MGGKTSAESGEAASPNGHPRIVRRLRRSAAGGKDNCGICLVIFANVMSCNETANLVI